MFEEWKQAWRQAVENFQRELSDGAPAAPRLRAMERELTSASGALTKLAAEIRATRSELERERDAAQVCRRREALARDAGDGDTERIAGEFAVRHTERAALLERKVVVLEDERALLARDVADMKQLVDHAAATSRATMGAGEDLPTASDDAAFSRLARDAREREADARLEELKRKMRP
ncbi:MAG TPA: hypothetical protein VMN60_14075 [Longimicrobiales bacterium]|nr:hypothetical protein [Longimicrobiales bacterium]